MNTSRSFATVAPLAMLVGAVVLSPPRSDAAGPTSSQVAITRSDTVPDVVVNSFAEIALDGVVSGVDAECRPSALRVTVGDASVHVSLEHGQTLDVVALSLLDALYAAGVSAVTVPGPVVIVNTAGHGAVRALSTDRTLNTITGAFRL